MPRYRVTQRYASSYGGPWDEGDIIELGSVVDALDVNRDAPGTLVEYVEAPTLPDGPPADRAVKTARRRSPRG